MSTSGTYTAGSPQSKDLIDDAYERIGILPSTLTTQKIQAAQRSLNFILQEWVNKGNNLWTIRKGMLGLNLNQNAYAMPDNGIDLKTVSIRTSTRNLGGTAFTSAGGTASLAFDGNTATSCTQTAPNGYISYSWGIAQNSISMVGVQSATTTTYTLVCEYSLDGMTWANASTITAQSYTQGAIQWFVIPIPVYANAFRVRETGGATLNVEELYFNTNIQDTIVTRMSEAEYSSLPRKNQLGRPSSYWVDRQINPIIYLWPAPGPQYNCLYFTYWRALQDIGAMLNNGEIPARFIEPLCSALAARLAMKEGVQDRIQVLQMLADQSYKIAGDEDRERVPLRIFGAYQGWGRP